MASRRLLAAILLFAAVVVGQLYMFLGIRPQQNDPPRVLDTFSVESFLPSPDQPINVTLWYARDSAWELQYITELFHSATLGTVTVRLLQTVSDLGWSRTNNDSIIADADAVNVMAIHGHIDDDSRCHSSVVEKVQYYEPAVVFILSDEAGNTRRCTTQMLSRLVPLVFRGFSSQSFDIPQLSNVFNAPLGHMTNQTYPPRAALTRASEREFTWSFVGWDKHERRHMIELLSLRFNQSLVQFGTRASAQYVVDAYTKAVFVPNTKGFITYDCFRPYEASRSGAIPVIVVPPADEELKLKTFGFAVGSEGTLPPWIWASNWTMAADLMANLLADKKKLDQRQQDVMNWWDRVMSAARVKIRAAVEADFARRSASRYVARQFESLGKADAAARMRRLPNPLAP